MRRYREDDIRAALKHVWGLQDEFWRQLRKREGERDLAAWQLESDALNAQLKQERRPAEAMKLIKQSQRLSKRWDAIMRRMYPEQHEHEAKEAKAARAAAGGSP